MRHTVPSREVPHLWMHPRSEHDHARNAHDSVSFDGPVIRSYRTPMGHYVRNEQGQMGVLWNCYRYSVTTSCHMSAFRRAAAHIACQFDVPDIGAYGLSESVHAKNLEHYRQQISKHGERFKRARSNKARHAEAIRRLVVEANAYAAFFGLAERIDVPEGYDPAKADSEVARYLTAVEQQRQERERRKEEAARETIEKWKAGEAVSVPYGIRTVYLRVVDRSSLAGSEKVIQTSQGAEFPVSHALRALPVIRSGKPYRHNGHSIHLGHYRIDEIDPQGNVRAGCHYVTRQEVERIAAQLGV